MTRYAVKYVRPSEYKTGTHPDSVAEELDRIGGKIHYPPSNLPPTSLAYEYNGSICDVLDAIVSKLDARHAEASAMVSFIAGEGFEKKYHGEFTVMAWSRVTEKDSTLKKFGSYRWTVIL
jgi:hypothetical protein